MQELFKMDKTAFEMLSFKEADKKMNDYKNITWQERLLILQHLNSIAYGYVNSSKPQMDKTVFSARKF